MKIAYKLIIILFTLYTATSCTKVIDIDLNSSDPQIVVEGEISNGEFALIKITKSVNFDESNDFPKVQNAIVVITDNMGGSEVLTETSPGIYKGDSIIGVIGRTYSLSIEVEGKTLSSVSTIPNQINFDSLFVKKSTSGGGGGPGSGGGGAKYQLHVQYTDPANEKNYYRFVEYINGIPSGNIFIYDDRLSNGLSVDNILFTRGSSSSLSSGDTVTIEMHCIDKAVYDYFNSFGNLYGGIQNSTTPANPYTNIAGSKLGYFSAHTIEIKQVIIH